MLSRERVIAVIQHRKPDRTPIYGWVRANLEKPIVSRFGSVEAFEDKYEFDYAHLFGGPTIMFHKEAFLQMQKERGQFLVGLESSVLVGRLAPRHVDRTGIRPATSTQHDYRPETSVVQFAPPMPVPISGRGNAAELKVAVDIAGLLKTSELIETPPSSSVTVAVIVYGSVALTVGLSSRYW